MIRHFLATVVLLGVAATPSFATGLVTSLSSDRVTVTSNYTGVDLVLFGSIESGQDSDARGSHYDIVATVTGPKDNQLVLRKGRMFGIWVNSTSRAFNDVPSYLAILSNKSVELIASADSLRQLQVAPGSLESLEQPDDQVGVERSGLFRKAFVHLKEGEGLYLDRESAVTFLTPKLFRVDIPMPANVPFGAYDLNVKVFSKGAMLAQSVSHLKVVKIGFTQFIADAATNHSLLYGFCTALMSLFSGWTASVVFRRN
jgi:uncharacterized protein (TIGR02186 family)